MLQKYLLLRGGFFYFRWRVPADLRAIIGSSELVKTLRTADRRQASILNLTGNRVTQNYGKQVLTVYTYVAL